MLRSITTCVFVILLPSLAEGTFLDTKVTSNTTTVTRGMDPAGPNTFVQDSLYAEVIGNDLAIPIDQVFTINLGLPSGRAIQISPQTQFRVGLLIGDQNISGADLANIANFSGTVAFEAAGLESSTHSLPFFDEAIDNGETIAFSMASSNITPADTTVPVLLEGFTFTIDIGSLGLLNNPPLIADDVGVSVEAWRVVPNDQVASLPVLISVVPEPSAVLLTLSVLLLVGLQRRRVNWQH